MNSDFKVIFDPPPLSRNSSDYRGYNGVSYRPGDYNLNEVERLMNVEDDAPSVAVTPSKHEVESSRKYFRIT